MMLKTTLQYSFLAVTLAALSACGGETKAPDVNPTPHDNKAGPGLFSGASGNLMDAFRGEKGEGGTFVAMSGNPYIWRASLEAVSFMPLAEVDSTGGVITTDWYTSPQNPNERLKINILNLGRALTPQSLKVNMFKQEKAANGEWQDVAPSEATVQQLEDAILTHARRLRVEEEASR